MKTITYDIELLQPVRIADITAGKEGETETLSYIPGSTMRGAVLSKLLQKGLEKKRVLLSEQVCFLNAYPLCGNTQMFPSIKGFYEGKLSDGTLESVLGDEDPTPGYKRASLGEFCSVSGDTISFMRTTKKEVLNNNIGESKIFRSVALQEGQIFRGYIAVDDTADVTEELLQTLETESFVIGSGKTAGFGRVAIRNVKKDGQLPTLMGRIEKPVQEAVMLLLSPLSMRNDYGEICGLDEAALAKMLRVREVQVKKAASSTVKLSGVNRTWGCRTPEITMYQSGSVFRLLFSESVSPERFEKIEQQGLGVCRAEGCGRVCFTDRYEALTQKKEIGFAYAESVSGVYGDQEEIERLKKQLAKQIIRMRLGRAVQDKITGSADRWKGMSNSQRGIALTKVKNLRYNSSMESLEDYIGHESEKLENKNKQTVSDNGKGKMLSELKKIKDVWKELNDSNMQAMGYSAEDLFSESEKRDLSLWYVENQIRYAARCEGEVYD